MLWLSCAGWVLSGICNFFDWKSHSKFQERTRPETCVTPQTAQVFSTAPSKHITQSIRLSLAAEGGCRMGRGKEALLALSPSGRADTQVKTGLFYLFYPYPRRKFRKSYTDTWLCYFGVRIREVQLYLDEICFSIQPFLWSYFRL